MNKYIYILIMIVVTFLIREIPIILLRKQINNKFVKSFLYYVPYVTLAVMTFPAICEATNSTIAGLVAFAIGIIASWCNLSMFSVSIICCVVVFILEMFI